jgi:DNA modification methylase
MEGIKPPWYGGKGEMTVWKASLNLNGTKAVAIGNGLMVTDGEGNSIYIKARPPAAKKIRTVRLEAGEAAELGAESDSSNVWLVKMEHAGTIHPNQKPTELAARAIRNSSRPGDIILDPFAGAGFTILAAQALHRRARAMEKDPKYCAAILNRLKKDGLKPCLEK